MTVSAGKNTLYALLGLAILSLEALGGGGGVSVPFCYPEFHPGDFFII
jgi:hypothetical protein